MGKSKGSTTTTSAPDAQSQEYARQVWAAAQKAGGSPGVPVDPLTQQAASQFGQYAQMGNLGFGALSGDQGAAQHFMNPYQGQVVDALNQQFGKMRSDTMNSVNDAATQAGAFGGTRHGVAEGVALANLGQTQGQQMAGVLQQGYGDAMGRAGQLANLGFGASGALGNLGSYMHDVNMQNDPNMRMYSLLSGALGSMPRGQTQVTTQQNGHNGVSGALGGAATGAEIGSLIPGLGTGVGAAVGGLMGLFG